jgi:hypothetical protein
MTLVLAIVLMAGILQSSEPAAVTIDYPLDGSIFPPEITPPTFIWHDPAGGAVRWQIEVSFPDGSPAIKTMSAGERMRIGEIDPLCMSETNEVPRLTPGQETARTWRPDSDLWATIKKRSRGGAIVTVTGLRGVNSSAAVSRGRIRIHTSGDPVGAPIFYRDVPLMPRETEKGSIEPLAAHAVRLVKWRMRNIAEPRSRILMEQLPMCANCHSFSANGRWMGIDVDGLQRNRGMYALVPVKPETLIRNEDVIQWRTARRELRGSVRVGFMSQVSPDGAYVVTTLNPAELEASAASGSHGPPASNYYVSNFTDYRFLQVFYPTRGILCWYSKKTGKLQPLPGADDPRFVQMGAVWSPDGRYLVFARAEAREPYTPGQGLARFANDPSETQIRYDLYRIPFNEGKGGTPEPIEGASRNGMSNSFPKISPDGRWIVFVKSVNGLLMRPDSRLHIVPARGGRAREMRCNTPLMNSWHSFSPDGRWMVFSSKSRSPYTQMYLTHIDSEGNDSPAILIENATAANRAVNIPEFVNVAPDELQHIGGPALDFYRYFDNAAYYQKEGQYTEAIPEWRKALEVNPDEPLAHQNLGVALMLTGQREEAGKHLQIAKELTARRARN